MSAPYKEAKPGRLIFKGGDAASLDKKKKKHKKKSAPKSTEPAAEQTGVDPSAAASEDPAAIPEGGEVYTIDPMKKMKYEELFPVETKRFGYDPKNAAKSVKRSVEEALDDRVKKKADRYCK
ncbi:hypothetical protein LUZ60_016671 [Juncus effusus]|nr:hypothetical protein LUZ60_016671 [Juncus effusus]